MANIRFTPQLFPQGNVSQLEGLTVQLIQAVVNGDQTTAKTMVSAMPALLFRTTSSVTPVRQRRSCEGRAAFQAALAEGDHEMHLMLSSHFNRFGEEGRQEKCRQFNEVFPDGLDAHFSRQEQEIYNFDALIGVIKASPSEDVQAILDGSQGDTPLCRALSQFKAEFRALSHGERIFNPKHLLKAFELYQGQFSKWYNTVTPQMKNLFLHEVIGYMQNYMPVCYVQAFQHGICRILCNHEVLQRSVVSNRPSSAMTAVHQWERQLGCHNGGFAYFKMYEEEKRKALLTYVQPAVQAMALPRFRANSPVAQV